LNKKLIGLLGSLIAANVFSADVGLDINTLKTYYLESMPTENIEDTDWISIRHENADKNDLPRVLMIGDSILGNYRQQVLNSLQDKAYISSLGTSACFGNPMFDLQLELVLKQCDYDVIHINNGLHGLSLPLDDYKKGMERVYNRLQKTGARVIITTTTPQAKGMVGKSDRIIDRNKTAQDFAPLYGYEINDLFSLVMKQDNRQDLFIDSVHYNEKGASILAQQVAAKIKEALNSKK
jgi:hypothetical protein